MPVLKFLRRLILPLLVLAGAGVVFVVLLKTGPSAPPPATSERVWQVRGVAVQAGSHAPSVALFGRAESPQTATLRASVEGAVAEVPVRSGEVVAEAAPLIRIDPTDTRLALAQREAEFDEAEALLASERLRTETDRRTLARERELLQIAQRGLARAEDLRTRNLGSDASVDDARRLQEQARLALIAREQTVADAENRLHQFEARRERALAAVDRAQLDLSRTRVPSPSRARLVEVHVSPGERVRLGDPLVRLYALDDLEIRASLPESLVGRIGALLAQGVPLPAHAEVNGVEVRAELTRLAGETRSGEAGLAAHFRVVEGGSGLPLNRFVHLRLRLPEEPDSVAVPLEALYGRDRVYRVIDERMQGLQVERLGEQIGQDGRTRALIRHPELRSGDVLVATRLPNAVDGLRVEVTLSSGDTSR